MKTVAKLIYSTISVAVAVIAFVSWVISDTVRVWSRNHSNWLYGALVIAVLAVIVVVNYAIRLYCENRELKAADKKPSRNDMNMLREIMTRIPRDGAIVTWLKTDFFVKAIPNASIEALDEIWHKLNINPLEFDDQQVNGAYENLKTAIESFSILITRYCQFEDRKYERLRVPLPTREGEERGYYDTLNEIKEGVGKLTSAYDSFLKTCSANGLDIYATESSLP
jgi:hypothetical protein